MALNTCANTGHICRLAITYCKIENSKLYLWQTAADNNVMHAKTSEATGQVFGGFFGVFLSCFVNSFSTLSFDQLVEW